MLLVEMHRPRSNASGFTLIETVVALSLLGVALLLTLSLIFQEPRTLRRLGAHQQAYRALEVTLEAVRAGMTVPPGHHQVDLGALYQPEEEVAQHLEVWTETQQTSGSGLYSLVLSARYEVDGKRYHRHLETLLWAPP
ncbi:MAG: prepilin-type N-terminal cleavage/methylation domain-containing protein [bacterium]|nr:prepilin-type N-terminal cleavage/methylation domain-containing protein [bacterium]